ncbi:hypothetical protein HK101_001073 [Irineochytrium annulatum]|nr:hypothetical protein HK101_001073 [Irineochytrium annulatum]
MLAFMSALLTSTCMRIFTSLSRRTSVLPVSDVEKPRASWLFPIIFKRPSIDVGIFIKTVPVPGLGCPSDILPTFADVKRRTSAITRAGSERSTAVDYTNFHLPLGSADVEARTTTTFDFAGISKSSTDEKKTAAAGRAPVGIAMSREGGGYRVRKWGSAVAAMEGWGSPRPDVGVMGFAF